MAAHPPVDAQLDARHGVHRRVHERRSALEKARQRDGNGTVHSHRVAKKKKKEFTMTWFDGVYIPTFTNIVGTLLYLRMGFVAGQAGIVGGLMIVCFSTFVISITALSLSGICSNGQVKEGGLYYVISRMLAFLYLMQSRLFRALGPQFGGVIGVIFSLANVGMAALYIVGIAEFAIDLMAEAGYTTLTSSKQHDIRVFSLLTCAALMLVTFAGPKVENGFTLIFFSTYFISYINWIIGNVSSGQPLPGEARSDRLPLDHRQTASTMYVDKLEDPGREVPKGIFVSIFHTFVMYAIAVLSAGSTMVRAADGIPDVDETTGLWRVPDCALPGANETCTYGLNYFYQVADLTSAWTPLLVCGMLGMTVSSTMTNLSQGPINFYAACKDQIFPYMGFFSKDIKRVYFCFSVITAVITCIGDLNMLNEFVSNLFLALYVVVNYAVFDASFARHPGWRPQFPFYSYKISLASACLSGAMMFVISMPSAIIICVMNALSSLQKLACSEIHVKNYRPQILLMSGNPASRVQLLDFAHSITKGDSLLLCAHVIPYEQNDRMFSVLRTLGHEIEEWLRTSRLKAFYANIANEELRAGMRNVFQLAGLAKLKPNVLMVGFKTNWTTLERHQLAEIEEYVGILRRSAMHSNTITASASSETGPKDWTSDAFLEQTVGDLRLSKGESKVKLEHTDSTVGANTIVSLPQNFDPAHLIHRHSGSEKKKDAQWMFVNEKSVSVNQATCRSNQSAWTFANRTFGADQSTCGNGMDLNTFGQTTTLKTSLYSQSISNNPPTIQTTFEGGGKRSKGRKVHPKMRLPDLAKLLTINEEKKRELGHRMNAFHRRKHGGRVDVFWLNDDGGLTLLLPHLLRMPRSYLEGAQLRVITFSGGATSVDEKSITTMLEKFRIEFKAVKVIDINRHKLDPEIVQQFNKLIERWKAGSSTQLEGELPDARLITDAELATHRKRTYRQLLVRQLLLQYSKDASLIVVTLPIPSESVSSCLYMSWLEMMSSGLPPVLMVRGNQTSVLTFYS
ncbi:Solute carrier family 12 member 1 [Aphelenchoides fujianensis]|nr:Solute carrier family 12 member 1 [Aphelenchoides fujianensis]